MAVQANWKSRVSFKNLQHALSVDALKLRRSTVSVSLVGTHGLYINVNLLKGRDSPVGQKAREFEQAGLYSVAQHARCRDESPTPAYREAGMT